MLAWAYGYRRHGLSGAAVHREHMERGFVPGYVPCRGARNAPRRCRHLFPGPDVVRDPRWGRTEECFGEDPYLISEYAVASVEGLQGDSLDSPSSVAATLKHFVGYGSSEGGRNAGPVHMGTRELMEVDMRRSRKPWRQERSIMPAYNEIDGVPCTVNTERLTEFFARWGFDGMVITDCGAIDMLASGHDTAEDGMDAAVQALRAGIDMEMSGEMFGKHLLNAIELNKLEVAVLDEAVRRVLILKFKLGLFENPYVDPQVAEEVIGDQHHVDLARQLARKASFCSRMKARPCRYPKKAA